MGKALIREGRVCRECRSFRADGTNGFPGSVANELKTAVISCNGTEWRLVPLGRLAGDRARIRVTIGANLPTSAPGAGGPATVSPAYSILLLAYRAVAVYFTVAEFTVCSFQSSFTIQSQAARERFS
jgi:hypothetical protein